MVAEEVLRKAAASDPLRVGSTARASMVLK